MLRIPLVDVKASYHRHAAAIDAAIRSVIESTAFIHGKELDEFEAAFAAFCETSHAVGVGSGTAAIHLALAALGVGPTSMAALSRITPCRSATATRSASTPTSVEPS